MVTKLISKPLAKIVYLLAIAMMIVPIVALISWLSMALLASGTDLPNVDMVRMFGLSGMLISFLLYFRWPWIAVIVSWIIIGMIIGHIFPWSENGLDSFLYQFCFELLFLFGANAGFLAFIMGSRSEPTKV